MEIRIAEQSGFCYGVMRAIKIADDALKKYKHICSFGPIIHNPQAVEEYKKKGLEVIENIKCADGPVIIRSHGVAPDIYKKLKENQLECVDATCLFVKEAQDYAERLYKEGYFVVIVGDKDHPEVKAHLAYAHYRAKVVNSKTEASLIKADKVGIISQTTQSIKNFVDIVSEIVRNVKEIKIYNTICDATEKRQFAALELAKISDTMIIIGGKNSGNTKRLFEICKENCENSHHIETEMELQKWWFKNTENVGITAGASTPSHLIENVYKKIKEWSDGKNMA